MTRHKLCVKLSSVAGIPWTFFVDTFAYFLELKQYLTINETQKQPNLYAYLRASCWINVYVGKNIVRESIPQQESSRRNAVGFICTFKIGTQNIKPKLRNSVYFFVSLTVKVIAYEISASNYLMSANGLVTVWCISLLEIFKSCRTRFLLVWVGMLQITS